MGTFSCLANVSVRRWISGAACLGVLLLIGVADLIDVGVFIGPNGLVSSPFGSSKTTDAVFSPMDEQHDWTPLRKSGSLADQFIAQRSQWGWRGRRSYRGDYRD